MHLSFIPLICLVKRERDDSTLRGWFLLKGLYFERRELELGPANCT